MKYYLLSHSAEKKETGVFPQAIYPLGCAYDGNPASVSRENLTNEYFPDVAPVLDFELTKKAKLTDIVSVANISARGLLLNEKAKAIFEQFNVMNHKFYPSSVISKGKTIPYYWLHIVNNSLEGIDFEKSKFMEIGFTGRKIDDVEVNTYEDYYKISGQKMLKAEKLILLENSPIRDLDLFLFPEIHYDLIASERLISALQDAKTSGIEIYEAEFI